MAERTGAQVLIQPSPDTYSPGGGILINRNRRTYGRKVREMRKHPTIRLARSLSAAPVLVAQWSIESTDKAPEGTKDFIGEVMMPLRTHLLKYIFAGCSDWGWAPFEKVFRVNELGYTIVDKIKPLLQDFTDILVDLETGAFAGFRQFNRHGDRIDLTIPESLLINMDMEGTDWYGDSVMEAVEPTYDKWKETDAGATRYNKKMAGAHWVIHYPPGTSNVDGVETDNFTVAKRVLQQLESAGSVAVPKSVSGTLDDLNRDSPNAWSIELLGDPGGQVSFVERQKYLDALLARAYELPERAVLEGQFGTKAEAEAHADLAMIAMQLRHDWVCQQVNWHLVNQLLRLNFGRAAENTVYIKPAPIVDTDRLYLRQIYQAILQNEAGFLTELDTVDMEAMKDRLGIPIKPDRDTDYPGVIDPTQNLEEADDLR
jgi:hypothetical protein